MEDLKRLENFRHIVGKVIDLTQDLEWAFKLGAFKDVDFLTADEDADELTVLISVEFWDGLALASDRDFEHNLTISIHHDCSLIAVSDQGLINVTQLVRFTTNSSWELFSPRWLGAHHIGKVSEQVIVWEQVGLLASNENSIDDKAHILEAPVVFTSVTAEECTCLHSQ